MFQELAKWCKDHTIDLVVVGPEDPLANGIVDTLQEHGIPCFGPTKAGAQIEANKDWSKKFMDKYQLPTARYQSFTDAAAAKEFINRFVVITSFPKQLTAELCVFPAYGKWSL